MNYSQITAQIAAWMNRDDLAAIIPDFISLAEERMNRALRVRQMEVVLPDTAIVDGLITLPTDAVDVKLLWVAGFENCPLKPQSLEAVIANGAYGYPVLYAWQGADLRVDGSGSVQGVLYERIPALSTDSTNWVSEQAPGLYLFGALAEAAMYVGDDVAAQNWMARFGQVLDEVSGNDQRRDGPLVARPR